MTDHDQHADNALQAAEDRLASAIGNAVSAIIAALDAKSRP